MERQLKDQKSSAAEAMEAQRELSIGARQRVLLADYRVALIDMAEASDNKNADLERLIAKAATAWTTQAMEMLTIDPDFRELTSKRNFQFRFDSGSFFMRAQTRELLGSPIRQSEREALHSRIGSYIGKLHIWQGNPG